MKRIVQTHTGMGGNCFLACVSSIMEVELDELPHGTEVMTEKNWPTVWIDICNWLRDRYGVELLEIKKGADTYAGYALWGVPSRNLPGELHSIVARDGKHVWDPHPEAKGPLFKFNEVVNQTLFRVLDPAVSHF